MNEQEQTPTYTQEDISKYSPLKDEHVAEQTERTVTPLTQEDVREARANTDIAPAAEEIPQLAPEDAAPFDPASNEVPRVDTLASLAPEDIPQLEPETDDNSER
ncbi:hypothetical protein GW746_02015, partial [Candidatus Saccharibacteria bacterium]|nr:hypothetical protein [Candidatus Saccharibacteria bacterium]NCS83170.1 hypothetical protein [Candidatus Saccharibacteria bacterium]